MGEDGAQCGRHYQGVLSLQVGQASKCIHAFILFSAADRTGPAFEVPALTSLQ